MMFRWLFRISSYIIKEFFELIRQPQLIFGLILAPFLILMLVGIGFQDDPQEYRTLFVAPNQPSLRQFITEKAKEVSPQILYQGISEDQDEALRQLRRGQVDLVITFQGDPEEQLEQGEKTWMIFYHDEIEPQQTTYMPFFARAIVDEVNNALVTQLLEEEQVRSDSMVDTLEKAINSADALEQALMEADRVQARREQETLSQSLTQLDLLLLAARPVTSAGRQGNTSASLGELAAQTKQVDVEESDEELTEQATEIRQVEEELQEMRSRLDEFQSVPARLLVRPLSGEARNIADFVPSMTDYFVGPVIALLLQHLAITFAGLSYVTDRQLGVTELLRVSPLKPFELLLGKYISHFLLSALIGAVLTALAVMLLEAPMLGDWLSYGLIGASLIFASIGIGFVLSLLSESDSHAVQYAMMVLLASVFFTGFFLPLESLWWPVRTISWLLPSTYGILMYHDVMLRGLPAEPLSLLVLTGIGIILFLFTWLLLRKLLRPQETV